MTNDIIVENATSFKWRVIYQKLRKASPQVFAKGVFVPLKIGIHFDIMHLDGWFCNERLLRETLIHHTSQHLYLAALVAGATRYDLNGEPAGIVTEAQAAFAAKRLEKLRRQRHEQERQEKRLRQKAIEAAAAVKKPSALPAPVALPPRQKISATRAATRGTPVVVVKRRRLA